MDYAADLDRRYWAYQESRFQDWQTFFERPDGRDGRPPVFLPSHARDNIIMNPDATREEADRLVALLPEHDRHKWFRSMNSSQALAQSVLGNLAIHGSLSALAELDDDEGNALLGKARVQSDNFIMEFEIDYLDEPRRTNLDAYIPGPYRVAIECKFTESEVGTCSRPRLTRADANYEAEHCDGTYSQQIPRRERCSLTEIGVSYWHYVPRLFRWPSDADLDPCPLHRNYQLVRNVLAIGVAPDRTTSAADGHVVLLYDVRNPAFHEGGSGLAAYAATRSALREPAMLRKCSWQRIAQHLRDRGMLPWLTEHLAVKYGM